MRRGEFALAVLLSVIAGGSVGGASPPRVNAQKITHYSRILKEHPERYPVRVSLAEACLVEAQRTLDPVWVARARAELRRSLQTQETFEAFVTFARVENFAHRFEDALSWAGRAATASVTGQPTAEIRLVQFEALLALGRTNRVLALLPPAGKGGDRFEWVATRARLLATKGNRPAAAAAFGRAAALASTASRADLAGWARVQQAGCLLDGGSAEAARPCLMMAEALIPGDTALAIHWGEYHEAFGRWDEAMRVYQRALKRSGHPLLHQLVWRTARKLGRDEEAARHFRAAEEGYRRAIDAGEFYTLGGLARLYAEAGVHLEEARRLARLNAQHEPSADPGLPVMIAPRQ